MIDRIKRLIKKNQIFYMMACAAYCIYNAMTAALFIILRIFPIQKNKIVCCNMKGKRYGDSPKYIVEEILKRNPDYKIIWLMKDGYEANFPKEVHRAKYSVMRCAYELATAKFWIDSNTKPHGTLKRKNQYYIQTWHGTPLKKLNTDILHKISFFDRGIIEYNSKIQDIMISDSKYITEIFRKTFGFSGEILQCGSPRNDIFFENKEKYLQKVQNFFHLQNQKIVLYAPTFRDDFRIADMRMNFENLREALSQRFGGEWVVLVRLHPYNITDAAQFLHYSNKIINATIYNDIQELLVASDVLITDYSSSMFDFMNKRAPCFIYATDIKKYREERDFYINLYDLPFPIAENNEEMKQKILQFDEEKYEEELSRLFVHMGVCGSGNACKQVINWLTSRK